MARSASKIVISQIIGFIVMLILLAIANMLIPNVNNTTYESAIKFFNTNLVLFFILFFVGLINELFWSFSFPFNILAPITGAVLSIYILRFLETFWIYLDGFIVTNINIPFSTLNIFIPLIVLVIGYLVIIVRSGKSREELHESHEQNIEKHKERLQRHINEVNMSVKNVDWEKLGDGIKDSLTSLGKNINEALDGKDNKKKVDKDLKSKKKRRK